VLSNGKQLVQVLVPDRADTAAARVAKLSITGATHADPPTIAPALMMRRRVVRDSDIGSKPVSCSTSKLPLRSLTDGQVGRNCKRFG
jgi:hypothetical protein